MSQSGGERGLGGPIRLSGGEIGVPRARVLRGGRGPAGLPLRGFPGRRFAHRATVYSVSRHPLSPAFMRPLATQAEGGHYESGGIERRSARLSSGDIALSASTSAGSSVDTSCVGWTAFP